MERMLAGGLGLALVLIALELCLRLLGAGYHVLHRGGHVPAAHTDTFVILAVRDSMTYGVGSSPGQDYPAQLERLLNAGDPRRRYRVVNGGVGGANSAILLERLPMMLDELQPDLVMIMAGCANGTNYLGYEGDPGDMALAERLPRWPMELRVVRLARIVANTLWRGGVARNEPVYDGTAAAVSAYLARHERHPSEWLDDPSFLLGVRLLRLGLFGEAEIEFAGGLQRAPSAGPLAWGLGTAQSAQREFGEARRSFTTCLELSPNDPGCSFGIGELLLYGGDSDRREAFGWFEEAAAQAPDFSGAYWGMAMSIRGGHVPSGGKDPFYYFSRCIQADPDDGRCYPNLVMDAARHPRQRAELISLLERYEGSSDVARSSLHMVQDGFDQWRIAAWVTADLEAMVELVKARDLPLLLHGYPYQEFINNALRDVALNHSLQYVDHLAVFERTIPEGLRRQYFAADGHHCNGRGYGLIPSYA